LFFSSFVADGGHWQFFQRQGRARGVNFMHLKIRVPVFDDPSKTSTGWQRIDNGTVGTDHFENANVLFGGHVHGPVHFDEVLTVTKTTAAAFATTPTTTATTSATVPATTSATTATGPTTSLATVSAATPTVTPHLL
jgi:hypothetical protein